MNRFFALVGGALLCASCIAGETANKLAEKTDPRIDTIMALQLDAAYGEYLASECATCHNETSTDQGIPTIHGQDQKYLINALLEYQDNKRTNETMISIANALNEEEIGSLALYLSGQ